MGGVGASQVKFMTIRGGESAPSSTCARSLSLGTMGNPALRLERPLPQVGVPAPSTLEMHETWQNKWRARSLDVGS